VRRFRVALATIVLGGAVAAQGALASTTPTATTSTTSTTTATTTTTTSTTTTTTTPPPVTTTTPATGVAVTPTSPSDAGGSPHHGGHKGGANHAGNGGKDNNDGAGQESNPQGKHKERRKNKSANGAVAAPDTSALNLGAIYPTVSCGAVGAPPALMPIYQQASNAYGLGPQGPGVLAAINGIESGFGVNLGPSSAGAVGWMQFLPSTWSVYGVDANGDGKADPNDPQDAIFSAARYLQAAGMPYDTAAAIFAYNHADWYVAEVLANAACYGGAIGTLGLGSGLQQMICKAAPDSHVPLDYLWAFEDAAARYDLGEPGVWALAAVARLESDFGRGMSTEQLTSVGPLGLDRDEWNRFEVDGDGDGRILHDDIQDAAATLAREIWSRGDLRAGLFLHNQAEWYVQAVLAQSGQLAGSCQTEPGDWNVALPASAAFGDQNVVNPVPGWTRGRIDMGVDWSAPVGTPILAPVDSIVIRTGAPGWPGGAGGVLLQLPNGRYMFIYESLTATVHAGQRVAAGQIIGVANNGGAGIEIGWADATGSPLAAPIYNEGDVTAWGQLMDQFLTELGAAPRA
jgi:hypothetical protein